MHKSREMLLAIAVLLSSWQAIFYLPEGMRDRRHAPIVISTL